MCKYEKMTREAGTLTYRVESGERVVYDRSKKTVTLLAPSGVIRVINYVHTGYTVRKFMFYVTMVRKNTGKNISVIAPISCNQQN